MSLSLGLISCGQSDLEAPTLKAESPYTCQTINDLKLDGNLKSARDIIEMSFDAMNQEYTGDSTIEQYYRGNLASWVHFQSRLELTDAIIQTCAQSKSAGIHEAAVNALTNYHAKVMRTANKANCTSYNNGIVTFEDVLARVNNYKDAGTWHGNAERATTYLLKFKSDEYGESYIKNAIAEKCDAAPDAKIWSVLEAVTVPVVKKMLKDEQDAKAAKAEAEAAKQKEIEQQHNLTQFGQSIDKTGDASCTRFREQLYLATGSNPHKEHYNQGLLKTLRTLGESLATYQQPKFNQLLDDDPIKLAQDIQKNCAYRSDATLLSSVKNIYEIREIPNPQYAQLIEISKQKSKLARECPGEVNQYYATCTADREAQAAQKAAQAFDNCDKGQGNEPFCFDEADSFYQLFLAQLEVRVFNREKQDIERAISRGVSSADVYDSAEGCYSRAIQEQGMSVKEAIAHKRNVCVPNAKAEKMAGLKADLETVQQKLNQSKMALEAVKQKRV